jgi:catechol 1,2-dioxygenase/hydroxyquinol 1,2-dioxygenase
MTDKSAPDAVIDLTAESVTQTVLDQIATTPDARMREVLGAAVRHAHAFAREVRLTPAEWLAAIKFLTEVGHACTPIRQEFILLSDTFGLSALVEIMHNERAGAQTTRSSLLGPFFREGAPELPAGACLVSHHTAPEIVVWGRVTDADGAPLAGATIGAWKNY